MAFTRTPSASFVAPNLTLTTANAAGGANSVIRSDADILAFDVTVPGDVIPEVAAATGSAAVAARRDHIHLVPHDARWFARMALYGV